MPQNIISISKNIFTFAPNWAIVKPIDRHALLPHLGNIIKLSRNEKILFVLYNFDVYPVSYSLRLMTCLPEIWGDISISADLLIQISKSSYNVLKRLIDFYHVYLGINLFPLVFEKKYISDEVKYKIIIHYKKNPQALFKDEIVDSPLFYNDQKMGITLDPLNKVGMKILAETNFLPAFEDIDSVLGYLSNQKYPSN